MEHAIVETAQIAILQTRDLNSQRSRDYACMIISAQFQLRANSFASNWFHSADRRGAPPSSPASVYSVSVATPLSLPRYIARRWTTDGSPLPFSLYLNLESGSLGKLGGNSRELMHRVPMVTDDPSPVAAPGGPPAWFYQARWPRIVPASLKKRDNRGSQVKPLWWYRGVF